MKKGNGPEVKKEPRLFVCDHQMVFDTWRYMAKRLTAYSVIW